MVDGRDLIWVMGFLKNSQVSKSDILKFAEQNAYKITSVCEIESMMQVLDEFDFSDQQWLNLMSQCNIKDGQELKHVIDILSSLDIQRVQISSVVYKWDGIRDGFQLAAIIKTLLDGFPGSLPQVFAFAQKYASRVENSDQLCAVLKEFFYNAEGEQGFDQYIFNFIEQNVGKIKTTDELFELLNSLGFPKILFEKIFQLDQVKKLFEDEQGFERHFFKFVKKNIWEIKSVDELLNVLSFLGSSKFPMEQIFQLAQMYVVKYKPSLFVKYETSMDHQIVAVAEILKNAGFSWDAIEPFVCIQLEKCNKLTEVVWVLGVLEKLFDIQIRQREQLLMVAETWGNKTKDSFQLKLVF